MPQQQARVRVAAPRGNVTWRLAAGRAQDGRAARCDENTCHGIVAQEGADVERGVALD